LRDAHPVSVATRVTERSAHEVLLIHFRQIEWPELIVLASKRGPLTKG